MKAIVALSPEELETYKKTYRDLKSKTEGQRSRDLFQYERDSGYAKYDFEGSYSGALVQALGREPTPEEIIMLVDGGFSHFGAHCTIDLDDRTFSGYVYID